MITRISIKNFQSHKDTQIIPAAGINVITGRNMSGKSALLRAMRLVLFNKPDGKSFVSWGEKNAEIEIECDDHTIKRIKGNKNTYVLDGSEFTRFGKDIPAEVTQVLGFEPITVESKTYELNVADPHEPPFLVSESDTAKGRLISSLGTRIVGDLVHLDQTIKRSNTTLREMNSESGVLVKETDSISADLKVFEPLGDIESLVTDCRASISSAFVLASAITKLATRASSLEEIRETSELCSRILEVCVVEEVDSKLVNAEGISDRLEALTAYQENLARVTSAIDIGEQKIACIEDLPEEAIVLASELLSDIEKLYPLADQISTIDAQITTTTAEITGIETSLSQEVTRYKELLLTGKECPICFRAMSESDLDVVVERLVHENK